MGEKSHAQGGQRTKGRHVAELGTGGALALLLVSFIPDGMLDAFQMNLSGVVLTGLFSTLAKMLDEAGGITKVLKIGLVAGLIGTLGCAGQIGTITPEFRTGADGETIVACTIKGASISWGDSDICRNVEGGHIGRDFVDMTLGVVQLGMAAVGGIFAGIGGMGASINAAAAVPLPAAPPETPPTITGGDVPEGWFE